MGLLTLLPVLGVALCLRRMLDTSWAAGVLHAVAAIVLILFVGGLAGMLWWTALVIHLAGVACFGNELRMLSRGGFPASIRVPMPILVLVACTVVFTLIHGNNLYLFYDEYSHWGVFIKEMLDQDGFWTADTNSMHPRYPPAAPLWQYFFNVFREPSEGIAYVAHFVFLLTPLLVLFENIEWRRAYWVALVLALCILAVTDFGLGISSLYVDHIIGVWFVGTVLCFLLEPPGRRRVFAYVLPLTMLALIKGSSFEFALAAAAILGLIVCWRSWQEAGSLRRAVVQAAVPVIVIALSASLALFAWSRHLDAIDAPEDLEAVGGLVAGIRGESAPVSDEQGAEITRRFLEIFVGQQLSNDGVSRQFNAFSYSIRDLFEDSYRLSTLGIFVAYLLWWSLLLTVVLRNNSRPAWVIVAAGFAATGIAYIAALYLTYRYAAGEYGLVLSSYMRYVHTIVLPMVIVSFAPLLPAFRDDADSRSVAIGGRAVPVTSSVALIGCLALFVFEPPYLRPVYEPHTVVPLRQELEPVTDSIRSAVGRSRVWVYLPGDSPNGFIGQLLQYLLVPASARVEREPSFLERDPARIHAEWSDFDYVWLAQELEPGAAGRFVETTGQSLSTRLFAVVVDDAGGVRLTPVGDST